MRFRGITLSVFVSAGLALAASACAPLFPGAQAPTTQAVDAIVIDSTQQATRTAPLPVPATNTPTIPALATPTAESVPAVVLTSTPGLPAAALHEGKALPKLQPLSVDSLPQAKMQAIWGQGIPTRLGFSPDGQWLGIETAASQYIYDTVDYGRAPYDPGMWESIFPLAPAAVQVREGADWALLLNGKVSGFVQPLSPVAVSNDGLQAAVLGSDGQVGIWDVAKGQKRQSINPRASNGSRSACNAVTALRFNPQGDLLAIGCDLGGVLLVRLSANQADENAIQHFDSGLFNASPLAFGPAGLLAAGFTNLDLDSSETWVWDINSGRLLFRLDEPDQTGGWDLAALAFSPSGDQLVSGYNSGPVLAWDLSLGNLKKTIHGFAPSGADLEFSPDGLWLGSTAYAETQLRTVLDGQVVHHLIGLEPTGGPGEALNISFSPGSQALAASHWPGESDLWSLPSAEFIRELPTRCCFNRFDHDGARLSALAQNGIQYYRVGSWRPAGFIEAPADLAEFAISPVEDWVIFGRQGELVIMDSRNGKHIRTIPVESEGLGSETPEKIEFSPDGRTIAFRMNERILLARLLEWQILQSFDAPGITDLAFSPDGMLLAAAAGDGLHVWDAATGRTLAKLDSDGAPLDSLAFSPDGRLLAAASGDKGVILVWGAEQ